MTSNTTTTTPNLEYYRKQAKALLKAVSTNDSTALARVLTYLPSRDSPLLLADAQWIIAREQDFASWAKFKSHLEATPAGKPGPGALAAADSPRESNAPPAAVPTKSGRSAAIGTDAVFARTGRHWVEWFDLLDGAGCAAMTHKQIVAVASAHCTGSWWQQMVAVNYERERGLRDTNMNCDGEYNVGVSRTLDACVDTVFTAWTDSAVRDEWLPDAQMTIRKAVPRKRILITWADGGSVTVDFVGKPDGRCQCTAEHRKLDSYERVERYRAFWSAALVRLNTLLHD